MLLLLLLFTLLHSAVQDKLLLLLPFARIKRIGAMSFEEKSGKSFVESIKAAVFGELSFEQLEGIEKRRRAILQRQGKHTFFRILLFWDGTLLKMLSTDPLLWLTMITYVIIRIFAHLDRLPEALNDIAGADISVVGAFLSFFLVLFVNDANSTAAKIYAISMDCKHSILDAAGLAKTTLPRDRALRLVRYMNAAHIAGYVGLSSVYTYTNFFLPVNDLQRLLTQEEINRVESIDMNVGESTYREIITWCLDEISSASEKKLFSGFVSSKFRGLIFTEQDCIGKLFDAFDQPINFAYYHFMCFLSAVYLPLFAISAAIDAGVGEAAYWLTGLVGGLIVLLQAFFVVGLRILGVNLVDAFGKDEGNLSVLTYVMSTWTLSQKTLMARKPRPLDRNVEEKFCLEQTPLGQPWDNDDFDLRRRAARYQTVGFEVEPMSLTDSESVSSSSSHERVPQRWSVDDEEEDTPKAPVASSPIQPESPNKYKKRKISSEKTSWGEGIVETLVKLRKASERDITDE